VSSRDLATGVCAWRGHVLAAASARSLDGPLLLGADIDVGDPAVVGSSPDGRGGDGAGHWRLARCLRCDAWQRVEIPTAGAERLPEPAEMDLPRRDRALRTAIVMRAIAVERGVHSVFFAIVAALAVALRVELAGVQGWVRDLLTQLTTNANGTGNAFRGSFVVKEGNHLLALKPSTLNIVIAAAVVYCVIEGVEAVGLWRERRWAEYLTVLATVGFIPYEISELMKSISVLKVSALVVNLIILAYLLWSKELFGIGRLRHRNEDHDPFEPFARPGESEPVELSGAGGRRVPNY